MFPVVKETLKPVTTAAVFDEPDIVCKASLATLLPNAATEPIKDGL